MRVPVELRHASLLLNHGPTTLLSSAHDGQRNVMAAAWVMPIDFVPPRLAVVIDSKTHTRTLVERSGELVVQLPCADQAGLTYRAGTRSGQDHDKLAELELATEPASLVGAPLISGCAAWLEARVIPEPAMQSRYDLFIVEVVAAWADDALWQGGEWRFGSTARSTIHHVSRGLFFATGSPVRGDPPT